MTNGEACEGIGNTHAFSLPTRVPPRTVVMGGRLNSRRTWVPGRSKQRFELAGVDTEITLEVAVHVEDAAFLARQREMREPRLAHAALAGLEDRDVLRDDA